VVGASAKQVTAGETSRVEREKMPAARQVPPALGIAMVWCYRFY
jgi:hypothetical protein